MSVADGVVSLVAVSDGVVGFPCCRRDLMLLHRLWLLSMLWRCGFQFCLKVFACPRLGCLLFDLAESLFRFFVPFGRFA
eukprot:m.428393 g.428393  ORF g.428393 m.428393 type:complete len:79 (+) comp20233_c0_seq12:3148-3384(+)